MANEEFSRRDLQHLRIDAFRESGQYTYPKTRQDRKPLREDYVAHAQSLLDQLAAALPEIPTGADDNRFDLAGLKSGSLVRVDVLAPGHDGKGPTKIPPGFEMKREDVVVLRTERRDDRAETAVIFVPDAARAILEARLGEYGSRNLGNRKRPHEAQFESVERILESSALDLFALAPDLDDPAVVWWELWIRDGKADAVLARARALGFDVHRDVLLFPDVQVAFVHGIAGAVFDFASRTPGAIAEIRRSIGTIEPFLDVRDSVVGQHEFVEDLGARVLVASADAPAVCLLDTGVAGQHPLIAPGLAYAAAVDADWLTDDHAPHGGHGTGLASLVLYDDLEFRMNDQAMVQLTHVVESVKLVPPAGFQATEVHSYGAITQSAMSLIEADRPGIRRVFGLAVSTAENPPERPSSWSGAIDQAAAGGMVGERDAVVTAAVAPKRLVLVAAGNVTGGDRAVVAQAVRIEDPAQAWNALTIGGVTTKESFGANPSPFTAFAPANSTSPFSADTVGLPTDLLPIKPEVLFEAGNMAVDAADFCGWHPALSLLTAGSDVVGEPLTPMWATSAAIGVAGAFFGRLQAASPGLWPETYRALAVQSARWPASTASRFIGRGAGWKVNKTDAQKILRRTGYGVPELPAATASARNALTLVAEAEIQPFASGKNNQGVVYNEMHFYDLPWPHDALRVLGDDIVTLKVTLSYFTEPNLSGKAATRPDTYRAFGLRFQIKPKSENDAQFRSRLSKLENEDQIPDASEDEVKRTNECWLLGPKAISAGSLHCDLWRGKASDLADHDQIAIYPVGGWWKSHRGKKRFADKGRYSLVVSILADDLDIDLYSEVSAQVIDKEIELLIG
ncbi:MAG: S8 family peptidase [Brevundimonas sp.]|nr:MAG: S8 family peptidase [Brevundimonas sp.]